MKFCYIDESADGAGRTIIAVGLIVDASRMHLARDEWSSMLRNWRKVAGKQIPEFKAAELYRGNGPWKHVPGTTRADAIDVLVHWVEERKHGVLYAGVLADRYEGDTTPEVKSMPDAWCVTYRHLLLALQHHHQSVSGSKGQTAVVIDSGHHNKDVASFVREPDPWTDAYYGKGSKQARLDTIVDVPFFVDSTHAMLIQAADLYAYILRRYVELQDLGENEGYRGEAERIAGWARVLASKAPLHSIYPKRSRTPAHDLFGALAPPSLRVLTR